MTRQVKSVSKNQIDMTTGPLFINIIRFILPLVATNLLQQFYHAADVIIVGLSPELDAVGAVGSTGSFLALIKNIFIGFSVGANIVVARSIGSGDREKASRAVHTSICMSFIFGVVGSLLGIALTRPVLVGMGYTGNLLTLAIRYAYIYLACMPFLSMTNFLTAILQAQGNTKTSLYVLTSAGILNIVLNLFFVMVLGLSVEGVAIATAIANLVSAIALWIYLSKKGNVCKISFRELRVHREEFVDVARIGFPAGIQNSLFSLSNIIIQSSILQVNNAITPPGSAYAPVIKGNAAASDIEAFIMQALAAITVAGSAFTAQNVGANNYGRVRRAFGHLLVVATVLSASMIMICMVFREPLLSLYGIRNTEDILGSIAYDTAIKRILWKWLPTVFFAIMNACSGTIRGLGRSSLAAVIAFFSTCVFRVLWIYTVFNYFETLESIYVSYPISWFLTLAIYFAVIFVIMRKKMRAADAVRADDKTI